VNQCIKLTPTLKGNFVGWRVEIHRMVSDFLKFKPVIARAAHISERYDNYLHVVHGNSSVIL
jgi:hypothetical protein